MPDDRPGPVDRRRAWSPPQPSGFLPNLLLPGSFTPDGRPVGRYGGAPVSHIGARDVAECAEVPLTGPPRPGEPFVLTGPQALTDREPAERIASTLGRPVGLAPSPGGGRRRADRPGRPARTVDAFLADHLPAVRAARQLP